MQCIMGVRSVCLTVLVLEYEVPEPGAVWCSALWEWGVFVWPCLYWRMRSRSLVLCDAVHYGSVECLSDRACTGVWGPRAWCRVTQCIMGMWSVCLTVLVLEYEVPEPSAVWRSALWECGVFVWPCLYLSMRSQSLVLCDAVHYGSEECLSDRACTGVWGPRAWCRVMQCIMGVWSVWPCLYWRMGSQSLVPCDAVHYGSEDCSLTVLVLENEVPDGAACVRINSSCRFIKDDCSWSSDKCYGNGEFAFHATRQAVDSTLALVQQAEVIEHSISRQQH